MGFYNCYCIKKFKTDFLLWTALSLFSKVRNGICRRIAFLDSKISQKKKAFLNEVISFADFLPHIRFILNEKFHVFAFKSSLKY